MRPDVKTRFGNKVRSLRKRAGFTQAEFADYLGLDRSYIAEIETGKRNPCLMTMETLAQGFGLSLSQLFYRV